MTDAARLSSRWASQPERVSQIVADIAANREWTHNLGTLTDQSTLSGSADSRRVTLPGEVAPRNLRGFTFSAVDLSETTGLADSALDHSVFDNVQLYGASLTGSSLRYAVFRDGTSLVEAKLRFCDLRCADLAAVSLANADLRSSDLRGADLSRADLRGTQLTDVQIDDEPFWGFLRRHGRWTKFGGKFQSTAHLSGEMDAGIRRRVLAETEFYLFRRAHPILGFFWYVMTNGGRSATRLGMWAGVVWLLFGVVYTGLPLPKALQGSALGVLCTNLRPQFVSNGVSGSLAPGDALYLSAVTMTTLGYGDITPSPHSGTAKLLVAAEAVLGIVIISMFVALLLQTLYLSG